MTRLEENKMVVEGIMEEIEHKSIGTYEERIAFQLSMIAIMLTDISKSFAIIADKSESEVQDADSD